MAFWTADEEGGVFSKRRVLDGGFGSELLTMGHKIHKDPLWSGRLLLTNPEAVKELHKRFLRAGAEIIETATYQTSLKGLQEHGQLTEPLSRIALSSSVRLAREAIAEYKAEINDNSKSLFVAASIGPYGGPLNDLSEFTGSYLNTVDHNEILAYFRDQIRVLTDAGPDLLAIETVPALDEAKIVVHALQEVHGHPPAWISFCCKDPAHTCHGEKIADVVTYLNGVDEVAAIGINCTSPANVSGLLAAAKHSQKPFVVYPNRRDEAQEGFVCSEKVSRLSGFIAEWVKINPMVKVIGGCCGVTPAEIAEIAKIVAYLPA